MAFNAEPRLSPDGSRIAYVRNELGRSDRCIIDLERHSTTRLLSEQTRFGMGNVAWSRDGGRISFESSRGATAMPNLYVMSAAGGQPSPFLGEPSAPYLAGWTPDSKTVIWEEQSQQSRVTGQVGGRFAIRMMGPDRKAADALLVALAGD